MKWTTFSAKLTTVRMLASKTLGWGSLWRRKRPVQEQIELGEDGSMGNKETQEVVSGAIQTDWGTVVVLAEGTGKARIGEKAALVTIKTFLDLFVGYDASTNIPYFFTQAFNQSNKKILELLQGKKGGAAAAAIVVVQGFLHYASVGDLKIALMRGKELIAINTGHTMQTAAAKGFAHGLLNREEALAICQGKWGKSNFIGRDGFKNVELGEGPIQLKKSDVIILMNEGVYSSLSWVELEKILGQNESSQKMAEVIIEQFNRKLGEDKKEASVVVLRYKGV